MEDPDAIWKPGYDGPPPVLRPTRPLPDRGAQGDRGAPGDGPSGPAQPLGSLDVPDREVDDRPPHRRRRWPWVAVAATGALVVVAALSDPSGPSDDADGREPAEVTTDPQEGSGADAVVVAAPPIEPPDPSVFGGPASRRLPPTAAQLWSVEVEGAGDHWIEAVRGEVVLVAASTDGSSGTDVAPAATTTLRALDTSTGAQRWALTVEAPPDDVAVVGAVDDVLVMTQGSSAGGRAIGVDVATGEIRWEGAAIPEVDHVALAGTRFVARSHASGGSVALIDAVTGRVVAEITGDGPPAVAWRTDGRGVWYLVDDGDVVEYDLRASVGEPSGVGTVEDAAAPRIVVDGRVVTVDRSGSIVVVGEGAESITIPADAPTMVRSLHAVTASQFVASSPGAITGATLSGNRLRIDWVRRTGAVADTHPVAGGLLLQVAYRGGASIELVDGRTGTTIEGLTMVPGALSALEVAGDGAVVLRASDAGMVLSGLELDGRPRWSIPGATPVVVGEGVVVRSTAVGPIGGAADRLLVTAYGEQESTR